MAESELDIKIRLKNEAEGTIDDFKEGLEDIVGAIDDVTKAAEGLGQVTGADKLAEKVGDTAKAMEELAGADLDVVVKGLSTLAQEAGVASNEFAEFAKLIAAEFQVMSQEALLANNSVKSIKFEEAAKSLESFISSANFSKLTQELEKVEQAAAFQPVIANLSALAKESEVTASTFGVFVNETIIKFQDLASEAAKAGDTVKSEGFEKIAAGIKEFSTTPEFASLIEEFKKVEGELGTTGEIFDVTGGKKDKFRENLGLLGEDLSGAESAQKSFNEAVFGSGDSYDAARIALEEFNKSAFSVDIGLQNADKAIADFNKAISDGFEAGEKAIADFNKAAFSVDQSLVQAEKAVADFNKAAFAPTDTSGLEKLAAEYNRLLQIIDPARAAQAKLAEQIKILDAAMAAGWKTQKEYNEELKKLQDASKKDVFSGVTDKIKQIAAGFTIGALAVKAFDFALRKLGDAVKFVAEGIKLAAQVEQLNVALNSLAATGTATAEALNHSVESLERLGFSAVSARENVIKMAQAGLELARVEELGAAAANQAVIAGKTREAVLTTLVSAIANRNLRALRSIGIVINQEAAELKFAESIGKTTSQLTRSQTALALEAAALEEMAKAAGAAEKGSGNLNQILIEIDSTIEKSQERLGKSLLPTATGLAKARLEFSRFMEAVAADPSSGPVGRLNSLIKDTSNTFRRRAEEEADASEKSIKDRIERLRKEINKAGWDVELTDRLTHELNQQQVLLKNFQAARQNMREEEDREIKKAAAAAAGITLPEPPIKLEELRKKIIELIGQQPKIAEGFTNVSREGGDALEQLGHMFDDFAKKPPLLVKSFAQLQEGIFKAFAAAKSGDDLQRFLTELSARTKTLGLNFRALEQEGVFRLQAARLAELNANMTAFIDATKQILALRTSYNQMVSDGVQHEIALQQIVAELTNNQIAMSALKFKASADTAELEEKNYRAQQENAETLAREEEKRARAKLAADGNQRAMDDALAESDKKLTQTKLKNAEEYYGKLKQQQAAAVDGYKQALLEQKKLVIDQKKASDNITQLLRELDRREFPGQAPRDVEDEADERIFQARLFALAKENDLAKEQLATTISLAREIEKYPGGFQKARAILGEVQSVNRLMAVEDKRAADFKVAAAAAEKKAAEDRFAKQKEVMEFFRKDVDAKIKLQLDPKEVTAVFKQIQDHADKNPISLTIEKPKPGAALPGAPVAAVSGTQPAPSAAVATEFANKFANQMAASTAKGITDGVVQAQAKTAPTVGKPLAEQTQVAFNQNPTEVKTEVSKDSLTTTLKDVQDYFKANPITIKATYGLNVGGTAAGGNAQGGVIGGYSPNSTADNILGWLTAGEYVQPVNAVRHYGTAFMESIRKMEFPRFAEGGAVGSSSIHAVSSAEKETTLHLTFQGKSLGKVHGAHDTVRDITKALKELSRGVA